MSLADLAPLGRWHPLLLHVPIGFLLAALLLEILATRGLMTRPALGMFLKLSAAAAVVTAASGWILGHEDGYGSDTLERHERLGIAVAAAAVLAAALHDGSGRSAVRLGLARAALVAGCVLLVPAGHFGATLTHGADWLAGPRVRVRSTAPPAPTLARTSTPLLELPEDPSPPVPEREPAHETADAALAAAAPEPAASRSGDPLEAAASPDGSPAEAGTESGVDLATEALAILADRCGSCHGPSKRKGRLRLDSHGAILAGGDSGPALVPGDPGASLLVQRTALPLEHEDHMPPEGKPQPSSEELAAVVAWIVAGAPDASVGEGHGEVPSVAEASESRGAASELAGDAVARDAAASGLDGTHGSGDSGAQEAPADDSTVDDADVLADALQVDEPETASDAGLEPSGEPPQEALAALERAFVHHEPAAGAGRLRVDVAPVAPSFGDAELERLLLPLAPWIEELSLARSRIGDAGLHTLARFPGLRQLDLRATAVSAVGLAELRGMGTLVDLNLAQTRVGEAALETLLELPALERVTLWNAGLSDAALQRVRARPGLRVIAGDEPLAEVLEAEGELAFSSDRPLPGAEDVPQAFRPVNTVCPVSGSPVNPRYSLVFTSDGGTRVIGFCCPNCPKEFWADPAKYAADLH